MRSRLDNMVFFSGEGKVEATQPLARMPHEFRLSKGVSALLFLVSCPHLCGQLLVLSPNASSISAHKEPRYLWSHESGHGRCDLIVAVSTRSVSRSADPKLLLSTPLRVRPGVEF